MPIRKRMPILSLPVVLALMMPVGVATSATAITATPVATGLSFPAAFDFASGGRIYYAERFSGEIRFMEPDGSSDTLYYTVPDVTTTAEQGVLGLALHPNFPKNPIMWVHATRDIGGRIEAQVLRIKRLSPGAFQTQVVFATPAATFHNGGPIAIGPDGLLYVFVGDKQRPERAQDLSDVAGKMLRMTPWGAVPGDNPFPNSRVFAYGLRNSFGFAFDPTSGRLWETENGPTCNDELNLLMAGRNYGWGPSATCSTPPQPPWNTNQDGPTPVRPQRIYTPNIAPTGAVFCSSCGLGVASEGTLFFGAFNTGEIRRVVLGPERWGVSSQEVVYQHPSFVLSMEASPTGTIYFSDDSGIYKLSGSG